jgi:RNA polymerase sigma-70 factor, ECF subfamily
MADDEDLYRAQRGRLFGIAYRMLGSAAEAEDVVQDAFLRLVDAQRSGDEIESPEGFLVTVTTRLGIDRLRSARVRREQYPGQWLPEPVSDLPEDDPAARAEAADSISLAFLLVLERLGPVERAVFVLRDVFDHAYDEIGRIVDRSPEACRQIALRARRHVGEGRKRFAVGEAERDAVAERFARVWEGADLEGLLELLAPDVVLVGDGGGKAPALPKPLAGGAHVAQALAGFAGVMHKHGLRAGATVLNGDPGVYAVDADGVVRAALALELGPRGVLAVRSQVNPDKLGHVRPA